jgi:hypothetical protein
VIFVNHPLLQIYHLWNFSAIQKLPQNFALDTASASDVQQVQPVRKQAMFKNMADARSCAGEDAGAVQSKILR